jgi:hypothetical protein
MIGKSTERRRASAVAIIIVPLLNVGVCCRAERNAGIGPVPSLHRRQERRGPGALSQSVRVLVYKLSEEGQSGRFVSVSIGVMMVACGVVVVHHLSLPVFRCSMYPRTIEPLVIVVH